MGEIGPAGVNAGHRSLPGRSEMTAQNYTPAHARANNSNRRTKKVTKNLFCGKKPVTLGRIPAVLDFIPGSGQEKKRT